MKIIAIGAVTAGGKTTVIRSLVECMLRATALYFDDYSFEGEVDDRYQWVVDGANYDVWDLQDCRPELA